MSNKQNIESEVSWVKSKGAFVHPSLEFSVIPDAGSCVLANNDINVRLFKIDDYNSSTKLEGSVKSCAGSINYIRKIPFC